MHYGTPWVRPIHGRYKPGVEFEVAEVRVDRKRFSDLKIKKKIRIFDSTTHILTRSSD
jgi:hypothetical protein